MSKVGLLIVIFGFFMPASCNVSTFDFTRAFMQNSEHTQVFAKNPALIGILCLAVFVSSIIGVIILILLCMKKDVQIKTDWIITVIALISAGIVCFEYRNLFKNGTMQYGSYIIIIGLIISLICLVLAQNRRVI
jgi:lysylphosphatidylglycerol synthetase-like protein (DUF2156 family)